MVCRLLFVGLSILALVSCGKTAESEKDRLSKENTHKFAKSLESVTLEGPDRAEAFFPAPERGGFSSMPPQEERVENGDRPVELYPVILSLKLSSNEPDFAHEVKLTGTIVKNKESLLKAWSNGIDYEATVTSGDYAGNAQIVLVEKKNGVVLNTVKIEKKSFINVNVQEATLTDLPMSKAKKLEKSISILEGMEHLRASVVTYKIENGKSSYTVGLYPIRATAPTIQTMKIAGDLDSRFVSSYHTGEFGPHALNEEFVRAEGKVSWDEAAVKMEIESTTGDTLLPFKKIVLSGVKPQEDFGPAATDGPRNMTTPEAPRTVPQNEFPPTELPRPAPEPEAPRFENDRNSAPEA